MSTRLKPSLDLVDMQSQLVSTGWETTLTDMLIGCRSDLPGGWSLYIDLGGRVRLERHYLAEIPKGARRRRKGQQYVLYGERTERVEIVTNIEREGDLLMALNQMIEWALNPPFENREEGGDE